MCLCIAWLMFGVYSVCVARGVFDVFGVRGVCGLCCECDVRLMWVRCAMYVRDLWYVCDVFCV